MYPPVRIFRTPVRLIDNTIPLSSFLFKIFPNVCSVCFLLSIGLCLWGHYNAYVNKMEPTCTKQGPKCTKLLYRLFFNVFMFIITIFHSDKSAILHYYFIILIFLDIQPIYEVTFVSSEELICHPTHNRFHIV